MSLPPLLTQHMVRRPQRIALLQHIAEQGSITRAAKSAGLSYKAAWDAIDELNNLAQKPLVERSVGGAAVAARSCRSRASECCVSISASRHCRPRCWKPPKTAAIWTCSIA